MSIKRFSLRVTAAILMILIAFSFPVQIMAQTVSLEATDEVYTDTLSTNDEEAADQGNIIGEDTTLRNEYTKYFITDTGCTLAAQYAVPIHFKSDSGEFVDYDNSLVSSQASNSESTNDEATTDEITEQSLNAEEMEDTFINKSSNSKVSHFKKSGKAKLIEITRDGHTISWGYSGANTVTAKKQEAQNTENLSGNEAYLTLTDLSSNVIYEDIYNNIDLEVINSTTGIKENIILKAANTKNVFKIEYNIGELTANNVDEKTIELKDSNGKVVYTISAPYMTDANGETSKALELKILTNNKGKLSVKLTADKTWLKDKSRAYPVTVDPLFIYGQSDGQIISTYVDSQNSTTNFEESSYIFQGTYNQSTFESYLKIPNLPTLSNGDMIVKATLNQYLANQDFSADTYVGLYEVKTSWDKSDITWENKPDHYSTLIDYERITTSDTYGWKDWDITELVKDWYNGGTNNGFVLKAIKYTGDAQYIAFTSSNNDTTSVRPCLKVYYRNNKGLDDRWSFTAIDCGRAGTAYINDYSGNLVFEMPLASTASPVMSAGLSYVYNSYFAGQKYSVSSPYTGRGWKMNIQQTLFETSSEQLGDLQEYYPYLYTDGDGTEHYFCPKDEDGSTKYYDESGYGLELFLPTSSEPDYIIVNKNNDKYHFNSNGLLCEIESKTGTSTKINYSGTNITSIEDFEGDTITFTPNNSTNNYVKTITDSDGKNTTVTFTGARIGSITYNDSKSVSFTYDDSGRLLSVTDVDGSKVFFTYSDNGSKGITSVYQKGANGSDGQKITFDRSKLNTTVIQTSGSDGIFNNNTDIITTCQFDNFGKMTSTHSETKQGVPLSASGATYTTDSVDSDASNIKTVNKISQAYSVGANNANLLNNHNLDTTANWTKAAWGSGDVDFDVYQTTLSDNSTTAPDNILYGTDSLKMTVNSVTNDARGRIYQSIDETYLTPGAAYTLSCYVKVTDIAPIAENDVYGAVIGLTTFFDDGTSVNYYSEHISRITDDTINDGFRRLSLTISLPSDFDYVKVNLAMHSATGTAYFDAVQLEKATAPGVYNMLENPSFERLSTSTHPTNWTGIYINDSTSADWACNEQYIDGNRSYRITGDVSKWKNLYQEVYLDSDATEADTYILSGWAKGDSVPIGSNNANFRLFARVYYTDESYEDKASISFNDSLSGSDWQYASGAFNLSDEDDETTSTPEYIKVYLVYNYQGSSACFDNIMLTKEAVPSYTYDDDGNMISVADNAEQSSEYTYTDDLLTSYTDYKNKKYTYTYYDNEQIKTVTTPSGLQFGYEYDKNGNLSLAKAVSNSTYIVEGATYSYPSAGDSEYSVTTSNQHGFESTAVYNAKNGTLKSATDNMGNTTTYSYMSTNDYLSQISSGSQSVRYYYDTNYKHRTAIKHGSTNYTFTYDEYGNSATTSVGDRLLSTKTYNSGNGSLNMLSYGNGDYKGYSYNHYGKVSTLSFNNATVLSNYPDNHGNIIRSVDHINNLETRAHYDTTNRLISKDVYTTASNSTADTWRRSLEYNYDLNNNITKLSFIDNLGTSNTTNYLYNTSDLLATVILQSNKNLNYKYDSFNRLTSKTLNTTTPIATTYTYAPSARGSRYSTNYISEEISNAFAYSYTYDRNGNITAIQNITVNSDGTYTYSDGQKYAYDENNQLKSNLNLENSTVTYYTYNADGNITEKMVRDWNVEGNYAMGVLSYCTYKYEDTLGWGDLLTTWGTQTFTYDEIGNPLTYRDGITMTWQNGRELATFENDDVKVTYTYAPDGLRTQKAVEGLITTDYVYESGKLMQMKYGNRILDFSYDTSGTPIGFAYRSNSTATPVYYYYGVNSRGDVEVLYNASGSVVAIYKYDAYGKILSITNSAGVDLSSTTSIATLNPLRYRGYVYDTETGLYYLQSRYYDPETCRFINADTYYETGQGINGYNMFMYCGNSPINRVDDSGKWWHVLIGAAIDGTVGLVSSIATEWAEYKMYGDEFELEDIVIANVMGSIEGACVAMCPSFSPLISAGASSTESFLDDVTDMWRGKDVTWCETAINSINAGGIGAISGTAAFPDVLDNRIANEVIGYVGENVVESVAKKYSSTQIEDIVYGYAEYRTESWLEKHYVR